MMNQQIIKKIIEKYGNEFGSGKHHLYVYVNDKDRVTEEEECLIAAEEGALVLCFFEDNTTTWIPYEQITEISVTDDRPDEEE